MKKLVLTFVFVAISYFGYSQQGSWYIGGGFGFQEDYVKVAPEVGTWLKDDLQLGLVLTFENNSSEANDMSNFAPHLYFRKWWPVGERFSLYVGANARPNFVSMEGDNNTLFEAFVDAGFAFAVAERWGIVGRAGNGIGLLANGDKTDTSFGADFNMSPMSLFNVGLYYTFKQ